MTHAASALPAGVEIAGGEVPGLTEILTPDALALVAELERRFGPRRRELLAARAARQVRIDAGEMPDVRPETAGIRAGDWRVAAAPPDFDDRRVEITGPAEAKMMINALNSGARCFMADIEDSLSPTWANVVAAQLAIRDAARRTLAFTSPEGREYRLGAAPATLVVRPRGWHLEERHVRVDGAAVSASLFDFGLYMWHSGSGTTRSCSPRTRSGSRRVRSGRRCSSRRSSPRSRWTRSSTNCAITLPA
jgi:malate synthase